MDRLEAERSSQFGVLAADDLLSDTAAPPRPFNALGLSLDAKHEALDADDVEEQAPDHVGLLRPHHA